MRRMLLLLTLVASLAAACAAPSEGGSGEVLGPEQALTAPEGSTIRVVGSLVAGERARLCTALLESYPPQCGGPAIELEGADLDQVVGLSRAEGIVWSDFALTVRGTRRGESLVVEEVLQPFGETDLGSLRLRFAVAPASPASGGSAAWLLDVTNTGEERLTLEVNPAVPFDVALILDATEVYRFTEGKVFTQSLQTLEVPAGGMVGFVLHDQLPVEPGAYEAVAFLLSQLDAPPVPLSVTVSPSA